MRNKTRQNRSVRAEDRSGRLAKAVLSLVYGVDVLCIQRLLRVKLEVSCHVIDRAEDGVSPNAHGAVSGAA